MTFFEELFSAIRCFIEAIGYIRKNKLWGYFIIPGILNLLIFIGIAILAFRYAGQLTNYLNALLELEADNVISSVLQFIIAFTIRLIVILIYLKLYRYIMLILLAPVLALMAQKLFQLSTGVSEPFNLKKTISDAVRGAGIATQNLLRELLLTTMILIFSFIVPPLSIVSPFLIFFVESYFYGFSMIDYFNELKKIGAKESREMVWSHKGLAIGNGAMFGLFLFIPVVGVLTAPMIALTGVHLSLQKVRHD